MIVLVSLLIGMVSCDRSPKPAPPPASVAPAATGPNAADQYPAAWARIDEDLSQDTDSVRLTATGPTMEATTTTWEQLAGSLRANQPVVADLMRISALPRCDFNLPSPKADLPRAFATMDVGAGLRRAARLLDADAIRAWSDGDADGAVDRLAAIYAQCAQTSHTRVTILALSNAAVLVRTNETTRALVAGAGGKSLSEAQKKRLADAVARLDPTDPVGLSKAIRAEGADVPVKVLQAHTRTLQDLQSTHTALGLP
jgi:hypothetical protein